jgi:hypothetical protein
MDRGREVRRGGEREREGRKRDEREREFQNKKGLDTNETIENHVPRNAIIPNAMKHLTRTKDLWAVNKFWDCEPSSESESGSS